MSLSEYFLLPLRRFKNCNRSKPKIKRLNVLTAINNELLFFQRWGYAQKKPPVLAEGFAYCTTNKILINLPVPGMLLRKCCMFSCDH